MKVKDFIIIGLALFIVGIFIFRNDTETNNFEKEREMFNNTINKLKAERFIFKHERDSIQKIIEYKDSYIDTLEKESDSLSIIIEKSKKAFDNNKKELDSLNKELEYVKNNPPNREGRDLLKSLNDKLKK